MKGYAESFMEVFTELGIPAIVEKQSGYFNTREVSVVLNALRVIDNPRQDIPLVSVLRSEMAGLTEEELAVVRIVTKAEKKEFRLSFYEAVRRFREIVQEEKRNYAEFSEVLERAEEKLSVFTERLHRLQEMTAYAGVPELLEELYRLTGYPDYMRVTPGGERRVENLAMLIEKAKKFEESSYSGIFDFVRYIEKLMKYEMDTGEAQIVSGEDAVRLMSIHKSKGLEAPVVIVAGLSKQFNRTDIRTTLVLHPELGMGMDFRDEVLRVKAPTLYKKVIAGRLNYEMLSEELRVLYVALTRSKEKLILSATVPSEEEFFKKLEEEQRDGTPAGYSELYRANSYLDFLKIPLYDCLKKGSIKSISGEGRERQTEETVEKREAEQRRKEQRFYELSHADTETVYHEGLASEFKLRENYVYLYPLCKGKTKLSVSELKKAAYAEEEQEELFPEPVPDKIIPRFMQETKEVTVSGSERGTLYHRIMECMEFEKEYTSEAEVSAEMQRLILQGRIRKDAMELVTPGKILKFFQSDLGKRMQKAAQAGMLRKEQPFVIGLPYEEVYKTEGLTDTGETVMVQGIIDAFFEEDGELVLMDYKTDAVQENVKDVLTKRYRTQLLYYEQALSQITGKKVREKVIYAFTNGEAFEVE